MPLVQKDNGIYCADVYIVDPRTKRRRRIRRSSGTRDKRQAEEWYARLQTQLWRQERLGERALHSWQEAVVAYMRGRERRASYDGDRRRIAWLDQHLGPVVDITQISSETIEQVKLARLAEVSPATVNRLMTFVRAVLNKAKRLGWIDELPRFEFADVPERKPIYLEDDEVDRLLAALDRPRTRHLIDFVTLAVDCGLRMRNVTHLKWADVDVRRRCVWIEKANTKGNRHIAIPLTKAAFTTIRRNLGKHDVYVLTHRGKPYDRVNQRTLQAAATRAGIKKHITPHTLRHTFATRCIHRGVHPAELMELGGWSKMESVLIYTHFSPERLRATAEKASHFGRKSDTPDEHEAAG
jgi:integrase